MEQKYGNKFLPWREFQPQSSSWQSSTLTSGSMQVHIIIYFKKWTFLTLLAKQGSVYSLTLLQL